MNSEGIVLAPMCNQSGKWRFIPLRLRSVVGFLAVLATTVWHPVH